MPLPAFTTPTEVLARVARELAAKGYTPAQMSEDPGVGEFCARLAVVIALSGASAVVTVNMEALKLLAERCDKELADWPVITADATQATGGQVVAGGMLAGWAEEEERYRNL